MSLSITIGIIVLTVGCGDYNITESDHDADGWTQTRGRL